jgi:hypothetical protein
LRDEVARLKAQIQEEETLQTENQALQAQIKAANESLAANDFFQQARSNDEDALCIENLKRIGIAARTWSGDYKGIFPTNYLCMSNELDYNWRLLQCPGDHSRSMGSWADVAAGNASYPIVSPGIEETWPTVVFVYCPIHHNYLMVDGSVQHLSAKAVADCIKQVDGKTMLVPRDQ